MICGHVIFAFSTNNELFSVFDPILYKKFRFSALVENEQNGGRGEHVPIAQFAMFVAEELVHCCNIDIGNAITVVSNNLSVASAWMYNLFVLELIKAYDCNTRNRSLIDLAHAISNTIYNYNNCTIFYLNLVQIKLRIGVIEPKEIENLKRMLYAEDDNVIRCGIHLLLGDSMSFYQTFGLLPKTKQDEMKSWPIYKLAEPFTHIA